MNAEAEVKTSVEGGRLDEPPPKRANREKLTLTDGPTVEAQGLNGDALFLESCATVGTIMAKIARERSQLATNVVVMDPKSGRKMEIEEKVTLPVVQFVINNESVAEFDVESARLNLRLHSRLGDSVTCDQVLKKLQGEGEAAFLLRDIVAGQEQGWRSAAKTLASLGVSCGPAFVQGTRAGHVDVVNFLLAMEPPVVVEDGLAQRTQSSMVHHTFDGGQTALMMAAKCGQVEMVNTLISAGADADHQDQNGRTALGLSSALGHLELVKGLLSHGVNIRHQDKSGQTALILAAHFGPLEVVQALLTGSDIDHRDKKMRTALMYAAQLGNFEVVKALLAAGPDFFSQDRKGRCALVWAVDGGNLEVVQVLLASTTWNLVRALEHAVKLGNIEMVKVLLAAGADINSSCALIDAVYRGHFEIVKAILTREGVSVDIKGESGETALMVAAHIGDLEMVEALVAAGADVDYETGYESSVLSWAEDDGCHAYLCQHLSVNSKKTLASEEEG